MKICSFLWVYYGYPTSSYEGVNVEMMRYNCGRMLAKRDQSHADLVAGVPDSGIAHAIGYANESGIPFARPFIKYTPTWPRSFMPTNQSQRNLIAKMKLIPVDQLIRDKSLLLIDLVRAHVDVEHAGSGCLLLIGKVEGLCEHALLQLGGELLLACGIDALAHYKE